MALDLGTAVVSTAVNLSGLNSGFAQAQNTTKAAADSMSKIMGGDLFKTATVGGSAFNNVLGGTVSAAAKATVSMSGLSGTVDSLAGSVAKTAAGFVLGQAAISATEIVVGSLKEGIVGLNAQLQDSQVTWAVLLGSVTQAKDRLQELQQFAAVTPFDFAQVDKGARILQTMGGSILTTTQNMRTLSDVAAGTGARFDELAVWFGRAYNAAMSGRPFGEAAMRLQELGALSGEARTQIEKLQASGASGAQVWAVLSKEFERFSGISAVTAKNFSGQMDSLKDYLSIRSAQAMKPFFDLITEGLNAINKALESQQLASFIDQFAAGMGKIANIFRAMVGDLAKGDYGSFLENLASTTATGLLKVERLYAVFVVSVIKDLEQLAGTNILDGILNAWISSLDAKIAKAQTGIEQKSSSLGGDLDKTIADKAAKASPTVTKAYTALGNNAIDGFIKGMTTDNMDNYEKLTKMVSDSFNASSLPDLDKLMGVQQLDTVIAQAMSEAQTLGSVSDATNAKIVSLASSVPNLGTQIEQLVGDFANLAAAQQAATGAASAVQAAQDSLDTITKSTQAASKVADDAVKAAQNTASTNAARFAAALEPLNAAMQASKDAGEANAKAWDSSLAVIQSNIDKIKDAADANQASWDKILKPMNQRMDELKQSAEVSNSIWDASIERIQKGLDRAGARAKANQDYFTNMLKPMEESLNSITNAATVRQGTYKAILEGNTQYYLEEIGYQHNITDAIVQKWDAEINGKLKAATADDKNVKNAEVNQRKELLGIEEQLAVARGKNDQDAIKALEKQKTDINSRYSQELELLRLRASVSQDNLKASTDAMQEEAKAADHNDKMKINSAKDQIDQTKAAQQAQADLDAKAQAALQKRMDTTKALQKADQDRYAQQEKTLDQEIKNVEARKAADKEYYDNEQKAAEARQKAAEAGKKADQDRYKAEQDAIQARIKVVEKDRDDTAKADAARVKAAQDHADAVKESGQRQVDDARNVLDQAQKTKAVDDARLKTAQDTVAQHEKMIALQTQYAKDNQALNNKINEQNAKNAQANPPVPNPVVGLNAGETSTYNKPINPDDIASGAANLLTSPLQGLVDGLKKAFKDNVGDNFDRLTKAMKDLVAGDSPLSRLVDAIAGIPALPGLKAVGLGAAGTAGAAGRAIEWIENLIRNGNPFDQTNNRQQSLNGQKTMGAGGGAGGDGGAYSFNQGYQKSPFETIQGWIDDLLYKKTQQVMAGNGIGPEAYPYATAGFYQSQGNPKQLDYGELVKALNAQGLLPGLIPQDNNPDQEDILDAIYGGVIKAFYEHMLKDFVKRNPANLNSAGFPGMPDTGGGYAAQNGGGQMGVIDQARQQGNNARTRIQNDAGVVGNAVAASHNTLGEMVGIKDLPNYQIYNVLLGGLFLSAVKLIGPLAQLTTFFRVDIPNALKGAETGIVGIRSALDKFGRPLLTLVNDKEKFGDGMREITNVFDLSGKKIATFVHDWSDLAKNSEAIKAVGKNIEYVTKTIYSSADRAVINGERGRFEAAWVINWQKLAQRMGNAFVAESEKQFTRMQKTIEDGMTRLRGLRRNAAPEPIPVTPEATRAVRPTSVNGVPTQEAVDAAKEAVNPGVVAREAANAVTPPQGGALAGARRELLTLADQQNNLTTEARRFLQESTITQILYLRRTMDEQNLTLREGVNKMLFERSQDRAAFEKRAREQGAGYVPGSSENTTRLPVNEETYIQRQLRKPDVLTPEQRQDYKMYMAQGMDQSKAFEEATGRVFSVQTPVAKTINTGNSTLRGINDARLGEQIKLPVPNEDLIQMRVNITRIQEAIDKGGFQHDEAAYQEAVAAIDKITRAFNEGLVKNTAATTKFFDDSFKKWFAGSTPLERSMANPGEVRSRMANATGYGDRVLEDRLDRLFQMFPDIDKALDTLDTDYSKLRGASERYVVALARDIPAEIEQAGKILPTKLKTSLDQAIANAPSTLPGIDNIRGTLAPDPVGAYATKYMEGATTSQLRNIATASGLTEEEVKSIREVVDSFKGSMSTAEKAVNSFSDRIVDILPEGLKLEDFFEAIRGTPLEGGAQAKGATDLLESISNTIKQIGERRTTSMTPEEIEAIRPGTVERANEVKNPERIFKRAQEDIRRQFGKAENFLGEIYAELQTSINDIEDGVKTLEDGAKGYAKDTKEFSEKFKAAMAKEDLTPEDLPNLSELTPSSSDLVDAETGIFRRNPRLAAMLNNPNRMLQNKAIRASMGEDVKINPEQIIKRGDLLGPEGNTLLESLTNSVLTRLGAETDQRMVMRGRFNGNDTRLSTPILDTPMSHIDIESSLPRRPDGSLWTDVELAKLPDGGASLWRPTSLSAVRQGAGRDPNFVDPATGKMPNRYNEILRPDEGYQFPKSTAMKLWPEKFEGLDPVADNEQIRKIIDEFVTEKNGFRSFKEAYQDFLKFIGSDVLVGHNVAGYDIPRIKEGLQRVGDLAAVGQLADAERSGGILDTFKMALGTLNRALLPGMYKQENLAPTFRIDPNSAEYGRAHTSAADVETNRQLFNALAEVLRKNGIETLEEFQRISAQGSLRASRSNIDERGLNELAEGVMKGPAAPERYQPNYAAARTPRTGDMPQPTPAATDMPTPTSAATGGLPGRTANNIDTMYRAPNGDQAGWKLHLNVDGLDDLTAEISKFLDTEGIGYKVGNNGGQVGKGMTIYTGDKNFTEDIAKAIHDQFGDRLPQAAGDVLTDDRRFAGNVWGRFDIAAGGPRGADGSPIFHQYGRNGIPNFREDMAQRLFGGNPSAPMRDTTEALTNAYGAYFAGTPRGAAGGIASGIIAGGPQAAPEVAKVAETVAETNAKVASRFEELMASIRTFAAGLDRLLTRMGEQVATGLSSVRKFFSDSANDSTQLRKLVESNLELLREDFSNLNRERLELEKSNAQIAKALDDAAVVDRRIKGETDRIYQGLRERDPQLLLPDVRKNYDKFLSEQRDAGIGYMNRDDQEAMIRRRDANTARLEELNPLVSTAETRLNNAQRVAGYRTSTSLDPNAPNIPVQDRGINAEGFDVARGMRAIAGSEDMSAYGRFFRSGLGQMIFNGQQLGDSSRTAGQVLRDAPGQALRDIANMPKELIRQVREITDPMRNALQKITGTGVRPTELADDAKRGLRSIEAVKPEAGLGDIGIARGAGIAKATVVDATPIEKASAAFERLGKADEGLLKLEETIKRLAPVIDVLERPFRALSETIQAIAIRADMFSTPLMRWAPLLTSISQTLERFLEPLRLLLPQFTRIAETSARLGPAFNLIEGSIKGLMGGALWPLTVVIDIITVVVENWRKVWSRIVDIFKFVTEQVKEFLLPAFQRVAEVIPSVARAFGVIFGILGVLDVIIQKVVNTIGVFLDKMGPVFGPIAKAFIAILGGIIAVGADLVKIIADLIGLNWGALADDVKNLGGDLGKYLGGFFSGMGDAIKNLPSTLKTAFGAAAQFIGEQVSALWKFVSDNLNLDELVTGTKREIGQKFSDFGKWVGETAVPAVKKWFGEHAKDFLLVPLIPLAALIAPFTVDKWWPTVKPEFDKAKDKIASTLGVKIDAEVTAIKNNIGYGFSEVGKEIHDKLMPEIGVQFSDFGKWVHDAAIPNIGQFFANMPKEMADAMIQVDKWKDELDKAITNLATKLEPSWTKLKDSATKQLDGIWDAISKWVDDHKTLVVGIGVTAAGAGVGAAGGAAAANWSTIAANAATVGGVAADAFGKVVSGAKDAWTFIKEHFNDDMFNTLANGFDKVKSSVVDAFSTLATKIDEAYTKVNNFMQDEIWSGKKLDEFKAKAVSTFNSIKDSIDETYRKLVAMFNDDIFSNGPDSKWGKIKTTFSDNFEEWKLKTQLKMEELKFKANVTFGAADEEGNFKTSGSSIAKTIGNGLFAALPGVLKDLGPKIAPFITGLFAEGGALAGVGGAIAAFFSSPIVIGALAVAATAAGLFFLGKLIKSISDAHGGLDKAWLDLLDWLPRQAGKLAANAVNLGMKFALWVVNGLLAFDWAKWGPTLFALIFPGPALLIMAIKTGNDIGTNIGKAIRKGLDEAGVAIHEAVEKIRAALSQLAEHIGNEFSKLQTRLSNALGMLKQGHVLDALKEAFGGIGGFLGGIFGGIAKFLGDTAGAIAGAIGGIFGAFFSTLGTIGHNLIEGIKSIWDNIGPAFGAFFSGVGNFFHKFWETYVGGIDTDLMHRLGDAFSRLGTKVHDWLAQIFGDATHRNEDIPIFGGIVRAAEWLYDKLVGHSIIPDLVKKINEWWNWLHDKTGEVFGKIIKWIVDKFDELSGGALGKVIQFVKDAKNWFEEFRKDPLAAIDDLIKGIKDKVDTLLGPGGTGGKFKQVFDDVMVWFDKFRKDPSGAIDEMVGAVKIKIDQLLGDGGIGKKIETAYNEVIKWFTKLETEPDGSTTTMKTKVLATLGSFVDEAVKVMASNAWKGLADGILSPFRSVAKDIGTVFSGIGTAISGALNAIGHGLEGFVGKFKQAVNWIANALKLQDIITDTFKWDDISMAGAAYAGQTGGTNSGAGNAGGVAANAMGTKNFQGGLSWVGEKGPELMYVPKNAAILPHELSKSQASIKGWEVPATSQTTGIPGRPIIADTAGIPGFAVGLNPQEILQLIQNGPKWLLDKAMSTSGVNDAKLPGVFEGIGSTIGTKLKDELLTALSDLKSGVTGAFEGVAGDAVSKAMAFALSQVGLPYIWGGGHGGPAGPGDFQGGPGFGWDCSGFVAAVLDAAGIQNPHTAVSGFANWGEEGRSGIIDIGLWQPDNPDPRQQHIGIGIGGQWFESGGRAGGAGKTDDYFPIIRHPSGISMPAAGIQVKQVSGNTNTGTTKGTASGAGGPLDAVKSALSQLMRGNIPGLPGKNSSGTPPTNSVGGSLAQWLGSARGLRGVGDDWEYGLEVIAQNESGGDPHAINNWDSNAAAGTPSKGLMQLIDATFQDNKVRGHEDIWDPVDNAASAIGYITKRYGGINNVPGVKAVAQGRPYVGYASGGLVPNPVVGIDMTTGQAVTISETEPEYVIPRSELANFLATQFDNIFAKAAGLGSRDGSPQPVTLPSAPPPPPPAPVPTDRRTPDGRLIDSNGNVIDVAPTVPKTPEPTPAATPPKTKDSTKDATKSDSTSTSDSTTTSTSTAPNTDSISAMTQTIQAGIQALSALSDATLPTDVQVNGFVDGLKKVFDRVAELAKGVDSDAMTSVTAYSDAATKVLGAVSAGTTTLTAMVEDKAPSTEQIDKYIDGILYLINRIGAAAASLDEEGMKNSTAFADAAGKILPVVGAGVDALTAMMTLDTLPSPNQIQNFINAILRVITGLEEGAKNIADKGMTNGVAFTDAAGKMLELVKPGVDALKAITELVMPSDEQILHFGERIKKVVDRIVEIRSYFDDNTLKGAQDFSDIVTKIFAMIKPAIDGMQNLTTMVIPSNEQISAFGWALKKILDRIFEISTYYDAPGIKAIEDFGDHIVKIFASIKPAIEGMQTITDIKVPSNEQVAAFGWALKKILDRIFEISTYYDTDGIGAIISFSNEITKALASIKPVVDAMGSMSEVKVPSNEQLQGLIDALHGLLALVGLNANIPNNAHPNTNTSAVDTPAQPNLTGHDAKPPIVVLPSMRSAPPQTSTNTDPVKDKDRANAGSNGTSSSKTVKFAFDIQQPQVDGTYILARLESDELAIDQLTDDITEVQLRKLSDSAPKTK